MKNKKIMGMTTACIVCTSSIVFASDIKILKKDNIEYMPIKKLIQKAGGKVEQSNQILKINIDGKELTIEKDLSFAKIDNDYYPLNEKELNGYKIPVDTKPLYEDKEIYIEKDFLKDNKLIDYKINKDNVIISTNTQEKIQNNNYYEKKEENHNNQNRIENNTTNTEISEIPEEQSRRYTPSTRQNIQSNVENINNSNNINNSDNNNSNNNENDNKSNNNSSNNDNKNSVNTEVSANKEGGNNTLGDSPERTTSETQTPNPEPTVNN